MSTKTKNIIISVLITAVSANAIKYNRHKYTQSMDPELDNTMENSANELTISNYKNTNDELTYTSGFDSRDKHEREKNTISYKNDLTNIKKERRKAKSYRRKINNNSYNESQKNISSFKTGSATVPMKSRQKVIHKRNKDIISSLPVNRQKVSDRRLNNMSHIESKDITSSSTGSATIPVKMQKVKRRKDITSYKTGSATLPVNKQKVSFKKRNHKKDKINTISNETDIGPLALNNKLKDPIPNGYRRAETPPRNNRTVTFDFTRTFGETHRPTPDIPFSGDGHMFMQKPQTMPVTSMGVDLPTMPSRLDKNNTEPCDVVAYYCLKAYKTGKVCGRTNNFIYKTFENYCMIDYVNCKEKSNVWKVIYMGACIPKFTLLFRPPPIYEYHDDYFLDDIFVIDETFHEDIMEELDVIHTTAKP